MAVSQFCTIVIAPVPDFSGTITMNF